MNMRRAGVTAFILLAWAVHASGQSAVSIHFDGGLVTLSVRDVPLRTVLAEWARVGGSRIVNAEAVTDQSLTLELTKVHERDALGILLRSVSGYMAAPRPEQLAGRSSFDRILILPVSTPVPATAATPSTPPAAPPPFAFVPGSPGPPVVPPMGTSAGTSVGTPLDRQVRDPQELIREFEELAKRGEATPQQILMQYREAAERNAALREAALYESLEPKSTPSLPASQRGRSGTPGNPFGSTPTAARPGEIVPAPQQDAPRNP